MADLFSFLFSLLFNSVQLVQVSVGGQAEGDDDKTKIAQTATVGGLKRRDEHS